MPYDIYDDSGRKIGYVTTPAERAAALMLLPFMILGGACLAFLLLGGWEFILFMVIPPALLFALFRSKWSRFVKILLGIPLALYNIYVWGLTIYYIFYFLIKGLR
jgi:hypothetical protein